MELGEVLGNKDQEFTECFKKAQGGNK